MENRQSRILAGPSRSTSTCFSAALAILQILIIAAFAPAAVLFVDPGGTGGYPTIQAALDAALVGDTVLVAPGTYSGPGNRGLDFRGKDLLLRSQAGAESTLIDCEDQDRGFYFHSGETTAAIIDGFTVHNGNASDRGTGGGGDKV